MKETEIERFYRVIHRTKQQNGMDLVCHECKLDIGEYEEKILISDGFERFFLHSRGCAEKWRRQMERDMIWLADQQ
jgi:hypothetical protein